MARKHFFSWFGLRARNLAHHWSTQFPICYTLSFKHLTAYSLSHLLYSQYRRLSTNEPAVRVECLGSFLRRNLFVPPVASRLPYQKYSHQLVVCHKINCSRTAPMHEVTNNNAHRVHLSQCFIDQAT